MNPRVKFQSGTFFSVIWAIVVVSLLVLALASLVGMPGRDSSAFIYVAKGMLNGDVPYLDRWDHKPPLIYLLNLAGLVLSGGHLWGIWLLEGVFLVCSVWLAFLVLKENFGVTPAFFSTSVFLLYFLRFGGGRNFTEEYVLLFQFLALYLFVRVDQQHEAEPWLPLAIGALAAGAFLLRPNLVGVWLAIGLQWIFWAPHALRRILWSVAGAALVFLPLFGVLITVGAWSAFLDATFSYNFAYSGSASLSEKVGAGLKITHRYLFPLVITGWFVGLCYCLLGKARRERFGGLLQLALILLPIEAVLVGTSGRSYGHYYLAAIPIYTIFLAFFGNIVMKVLTGFTEGRAVSEKDEFLIQTITTFLLLALFLNAARPLRNAFSNTAFRIEKYTRDGEIFSGNHLRVAERVRNKTEPGERILVWGATSQIYLFSDRQAPSRFFYQYPLITRNYASDSIFDEFISDVKENKPALIIDTRNKRLPPLSITERLVWQQADSNWYTYSPEAFEPFFSFVEEEYEVIEEVGRYAIYGMK